MDEERYDRIRIGQWLAGEATLSRRSVLRTAGLGGATWRRPRIRRRGEAWIQWELPWHPPGPGAYELLARATDETGRTQPGDPACGRPARTAGGRS